MTLQSPLTTPPGDRDLIRTHDRGSRTYSIDGLALPSVTTIVSQGEPKPALVGWAKKVTAEAAVAQRDLVTRIIAAEGEQAAVDHLKGAAYRQRNAAGDLGSRLHEVAEWEILNGKPYPDPGDPEARALLAQFRHFVAATNPEWHAVEAIVYSVSDHYAGTLDAIATLNIGQVPAGPALIDWKSGSGVYGSFALQLAAYAHADYLLGPQGPIEMDEFDVSWGAVVHITPRGWRLVEVDIGPEIYEAFLTTRDMAAWAQQSNTAVGRVLAHGQAAAAQFNLPGPAAAAPPTPTRASADVADFAARRRIKPPKL